MSRSLPGARLLMERQRYSQALRQLREAVREAPESAEARALLGECLLALRQPADAVAAGRRAVALEPENSSVHASLAWVLLQTDQRKEALAAAHAARTLAPDTPGPLWLLASIALRDGELLRAIALVDQALALAPEDASALALRAEILLRADRPEEAVAASAAALPGALEDANVLHLRAMASVQLRDLAGAERLLEAAVRADPVPTEHRAALTQVRLMRLPVLGALFWVVAWLERRAVHVLLWALGGTGLFMDAVHDGRAAVLAPRTERSLRASEGRRLAHRAALLSAGALLLAHLALGLPAPWLTGVLVAAAFVSQP